MRDVALAGGLGQCGHEVVVVPLYLPLVLDATPLTPLAPLFAGGMNMFLQHKCPPFRRLPYSVTHALDAPWLLRAASAWTGMTRIRDLGTMTLDGYRGVHGGQRNEWRRLLEWLASQRLDALIVSNGLLAGVARDWKEAFGSSVPVVVTLQGEDSFLETLSEPFRSRCWEAFRTSVSAVDACVAVSSFYRERMCGALGLSREAIAVIPPGIDLSRYPQRQRLPANPTIGFLARMCKGKGLDCLVEAFLLLRGRGLAPRAALRIAGTATRADRPFLRSLRRRLRAAGCADAVTFHPNLSLEEKVEFLRGISVLSVPATYGEAFGMYVIEAMATGVPLVQPAHGPFPESVGETGAGLLVAPDDPRELALAWEQLLSDPSLQEQIGTRGRSAASKNYSVALMAQRHEQLLAGLRTGT